MSTKDYEKLNNFFWFFSLDLKSSKETTQSVIKNWVNKNDKYNKDSWEFDLTAKRIIAWLSNHQLSYQDSDKEYRLMFDHMIQKQANHLLSEIRSSNTLENKLTNGGSYKNDTVDGVTYGLGIKGEWAGFYTKLALERTNFDEYVSSSGTTNTITADLDVDQVKSSIGKAF